jgi:DNA-binding CsgD family transcriptional regulator
MQTVQEEQKVELDTAQAKSARFVSASDPTDINPMENRILFDFNKAMPDGRSGSKRLIVRSLSPIRTSDHRLVLTEKNEELDAVPFETLGLTKREAEVLLWVSQGKRNAEIATILGIRAKRISKHLERVFAKLGVETRTNAANVALSDALLALFSPGGPN